MRIGQISMQNQRIKVTPYTPWAKRWEEWKQKQEQKDDKESTNDHTGNKE